MDKIATKATRIKQERIADGNEELLLNSEIDVSLKVEDTDTADFIIKNEETDILEFKCRCCKFVADSYVKLEKHENGHRTRGTFLECDYCDFCTNTKEVMIQHVTKHTGERPFKCQKCDFSSRWKRDLIKHQVKHSDEKRYMCSQCDFTTKWYNNIHHHQITHSTDRPFTCHICDMKFKRKTGLDYHLYRHNDYKPKKCPKCDFRCKTNFELKYHQHKHSDIRNYPCTFPGCAQKCKTKSDLNKHLKIHTNIRDKICDICDKGFVTLANLSKHKLRHVTERNFKCDLCTSRFKTRTSLRHHLQTHNDNKPFSCDICGHEFRNRHNLKTHKLTHSDDRKYKCPICPYAGKFPFHIFAHIGTFHGDQFAYFCEICRKPFSRYSQLQTHCGRMHKDKDMLKATDTSNIKEENIDDETTKISPISDHSEHTEPSSSTMEKTSSGLKTDLNHTEPTVIPSVNKDKTNGNNDEVPVTETSAFPKSEEPNVIIYNIGPFRLPLASKGFNFNFDKTGKKPKHWFMDPSNMADEKAAEKQRAYMEKKARSSERSRGATMRKFGWKKPPFKPRQTVNPRYKKEQEVKRRERDIGRGFVKQDPELNDLINAGRKNIKKIKICKRAGQLMKHWKELEVKLEKMVETSETCPITEDPQFFQIDKSLDLPSITSSGLNSVKQYVKVKTDVGFINEESQSSPDKEVANKRSESSAFEEDNLLLQPSTKNLQLKPRKKKGKRPVGRPRKARKKTKATKSAINETQKRLQVMNVQTIEASDQNINDTNKNMGTSKVKKPVGRPCKRPHEKATLPRSKHIKSVNDLLVKTPQDVDLISHKIQFEVEAPGIGKYSSTVLVESEDVSNIPHIITLNGLEPSDSRNSISPAEQISDVTTCSKRDSLTTSAPFMPTGKLTLAINKLLEKKCKETSPSNSSEALSNEKQICTYPMSEEDISSCHKRHRKSVSPRKVKKKTKPTNKKSSYSIIDIEINNTDECIPSNTSIGVSNRMDSAKDEALKIVETSKLVKRSIGRPRKNPKIPNISDKGRITLQDNSEVDTSSKKILENLLRQPFRNKRNLTDIDVLEIQTFSDDYHKDVTAIHSSCHDGTKQYKSNSKYIPSNQYLYDYSITSLAHLLKTTSLCKPQLTLKTTDHVGPELEKGLSQLDINSACYKQDLMKIQKCLQNEKYRLKRKASGYSPIDMISNLIPSTKKLKEKTHNKLKSCQKIEEGLRKNSDCPILKGVLLKKQEAEKKNNIINNDIVPEKTQIIEVVDDAPVVLKIPCIHKAKQTRYSKNKTSKNIVKEKKTLAPLEVSKPKHVKKTALNNDISGFFPKYPVVLLDQMTTAITQKVERIKRKYIKRSAFWTNESKSIVVQEKTCEKIARGDNNKKLLKAGKPCNKNTKAKKPLKKIVSGDDLTEQSSTNIRQVLQNYITNRRQSSLKKKTSKKGKGINISSKSKGSGNVKKKKTTKKGKATKTQNNEKVKKKKQPKISVRSKKKTNDVEIYLDIEESEMLQNVAESLKSQTARETNSDFVSDNQTVTETNSDLVSENQTATETNLDLVLANQISDGNFVDNNLVRDSHYPEYTKMEMMERVNDSNVIAGQPLGFVIKTEPVGAVTEESVMGTEVLIKTEPICVVKQESADMCSSVKEECVHKQDIVDYNEQPLIKTEDIGGDGNTFL